MNSISENPYATFTSKKGHNFIKFGSERIKSLTSAFKTSEILFLVSSLNCSIDAISWLSKAVFENAVIFNQEIVRR